MTEKKVLVVVDGYNLYYSVCKFVQKVFHGKSRYLWYDLFRLVKPHLKEGEIIDKLCYCSAAYDSDGSSSTEKIERQKKVQRIYIKHHTDTYGEKFVSVMGRFSNKKEKETDVNIAVKTTVGICKNTHSRIILVSGDTDFEPLFEFAAEEQTEMLRLLPPSPNTRFRYPEYPKGLITGKHIQDACFADQVPPGTPEPRRYPEDDDPPGSVPPPEIAEPPEPFDAPDA